MRESISLNCEETVIHITEWIQKTVKQTACSTVVVGVSGGIDSAVSTTLLTRALGKEHVYAVMLPYGSLHPEGVTDALSLLEGLHLPKDRCLTIDIKDAVDSIAQTAQVDGESLRRGNIMARVRMLFLFDLAKKQGALVCGTENRTEHYLGYFTRFGDEASDLEPIRHLYKTQVRELAAYLHIPQAIITKAPTAGLWKNQTDEGEFGFTYADADAVLFSFFDKKLSPEAIVNTGIVSPDVVTKVLARVAKNDFKKHLPYVYE